MTRKKVKLAFIVNDASRKATYKKRKKGLLKKVSELSTLCGIEACAVIYSPYETQPEVWPNVLGAQRVITKFKRMPEMEQSKKMVNQESFIRQRIIKASEQLKKQRDNNAEKEMKEVMYQCLTGAGFGNLGLGELNHLGRMLDQNLKEVSKRIEMLSVKGEGSNMSKEMIMQVEEQQKASLDFRPQWYNEWVNNHIGFGVAGGLDTITLPFGDNNSNNNNNNNTTWSSAFFP